MNTLNLKAETRPQLGRKSKRVRAQGFIPANVYGKGVDSMALSVEAMAFKKVFDKAGETGLVQLEIGEESRPVLVSNIQNDPVTDQILHVDFRQVNLKEKVEAQVPVEIIGESPVEKSGEGTVVTQLSEIEVSALPMDLPENFVVDISILTEVDQAIYVKDLKYDHEKIEILEDLEAIIVKVEPPQKEEVVEVAPAEPVEGETAVEGEQPTQTIEATDTSSEEKPES